LWYQVPPTPLAFSSTTKSSKPSCASRAAMHSPPGPAPMIAMRGVGLTAHY